MIWNHLSFSKLFEIWKSNELWQLGHPTGCEWYISNWRIVKAKVLQNYLLKMKNGCPMSSFASKNALVYNVLMAVRVLRVLHWFIFKIHSYIYVLTKSSNIYFGYASHVLWVAYNIFWINDVQAWLHSSDPCWVCVALHNTMG